MIWAVAIRGANWSELACLRPSRDADLQPKFLVRVRVNTGRGSRNVWLGAFGAHGRTEWVLLRQATCALRPSARPALRCRPRRRYGLSESLLSITLSVILGDASEVFDSRVAQDPLAKPSASCKRTGLRDVL